MSIHGELHLLDNIYYWIIVTFEKYHFLLHSVESVWYHPYFSNENLRLHRDSFQNWIPIYFVSVIKVTRLSFTEFRLINWRLSIFSWEMYVMNRDYLIIIIYSSVTQLRDFYWNVIIKKWSSQNSLTSGWYEHGFWITMDEFAQSFSFWLSWCQDSSHRLINVRVTIQESVDLESWIRTEILL